MLKYVTHIFFVVLQNYYKVYIKEFRKLLPDRTTLSFFKLIISCNQHKWREKKCKYDLYAAAYNVSVFLKKLTSVKNHHHLCWHSFSCLYINQKFLDLLYEVFIYWQFCIINTLPFTRIKTYASTMSSASVLLYTTTVL